jgi:hypothetical protein
MKKGLLDGDENDDTFPIESEVLRAEGDGYASGNTNQNF